MVAGVLAMAAAAVGTGAAQAQTALPAVRAHLYNDHANAHADIAAALQTARREHKHVLVDFGGDWCGDCQVLHAVEEQPQNRALLAAHYVEVHVSVGSTGIEKNIDIGDAYGIPLKHGVPAVAVLNAQGKVLTSSRSKEFERIAAENPQGVTEFLEHWK